LRQADAFVRVSRPVIACPDKILFLRNSLTYNKREKEEMQLLLLWAGKGLLLVLCLLISKRILLLPKCKTCCLRSHRLGKQGAQPGLAEDKLAGAAAWAQEEKRGTIISLLLVALLGALWVGMSGEASTEPLATSVASAFIFIGGSVYVCRRFAGNRLCKSCPDPVANPQEEAETLAQAQARKKHIILFIALVSFLWALVERQIFSYIYP
jgi:hypothetical protein